MRGISRIVVVLVAACLLVGIASPSRAAIDAKKKCAKVTASSGITWDHSDPARLQIVPHVTWQHCKGVVRRVEMLTYTTRPDGTFGSYKRDDLTRELSGTASGKQTFSHPYFILDFNGDMPFPDAEDSEYQSCTRLNNGAETAGMNGFTFHTKVTLYGAFGKKLLELKSPPVACDQNS